ncbi:charged multivesicular body protein 2b-B-like [Watersipora subatra]|uniref:charged multivesicular body protein 2b-B-like n=1 Tax=Watersipora subatra TaxID=2589382 RepID=UPI00355B4DCA
MPLFGKEPTVKEQLRNQDRALKKVDRDLARDRNGLERQEKLIEQQIKQAAKRGDKQTCTILAKQLVNMRKTKTKSVATGARVQAIGNQSKVMNSNMKMAEAMGTTSKTMQQMNKIMDPQKMAAQMDEFTKQSMKMGMTEDMVNDTLDEMLDESGDEEEQDAIVTQVLDEIGIDITGKLAQAPSAYKGSIGAEAAASKTDDDLERQLNALKNM